MRSYELERKRLAHFDEAFGGEVELVEVPYRQARESMRKGAPEFTSEGLLGATLHVDGEPIGLDALLAMPGRFCALIAEGVSLAIRMHGLGVEVAPAAANDGDATPAATGTHDPKH